MNELKQAVATTAQIRPEPVTDDSPKRTLSQWGSQGHNNMVMAFGAHRGASFTADEVVEMHMLAESQPWLEEGTL